MENGFYPNTQCPKFPILSIGDITADNNESTTTNDDMTLHNVVT